MKVKFFGRFKINLICIIYKSKLIILLKINFLYSVYMFVLGIRFIFYTKIVNVYCLYFVAILLKLFPFCPHSLPLQVPHRNPDFCFFKTQN